MSTYYLFDMHVPGTSVGTGLENSKLVDVVQTDADTAEFRCDGLVPIKVPEGVRVVNPANLQDVLDQKYLSIFSKFAGFQYYLTDNLLDASIINLTSPPAPQFMKKAGSRATIGGNVRTNAFAAPITVTQCIVVYETFTWRYVDTRDGRFERYYVEEPDTLRPARVSVNGGTNFTSTVSGGLVEFPALEQGTSIVLEFLSTNPSDLFQDGRLVHIGSFAVIL